MVFKTHVGVCTPAVLRKSFALRGVEERCFGGGNRLFTLLMLQRVMWGVREPQGMLSCWGGAQQGRVQGKKLGLTSGPGSAASWYPCVCDCATTPEEDRPSSHITCSLLPWPCVLLRPGASRTFQERGNSQS